MFLKNQQLLIEKIFATYLQKTEFLYLQANNFHHQIFLDGELEFSIDTDDTMIAIKNKTSIGPEELSAYSVEKCTSNILNTWINLIALRASCKKVIS